MRWVSPTDVPPYFCTTSAPDGAACDSPTAPSSLTFSAVPTDKRQRQREGRQSRQQAAVAERKKEARRRTATVMVLILVVGFIGLALVNRGGGKKDNPTVAANGRCPKVDGSSPKTATFSAPPPMCIKTNKHYTA